METAKLKSSQTTTTSSDEKILIYEETGEIGAIEHLIAHIPEMLKAVIQAYRTMGIEPPLTINEIESLTRTTDIDDWLRSRIVDASELPKIGTFVIERQKAKELLSLPNYSTFISKLNQLLGLCDNIIISKFFEIDYAGENGQVVLIRIREAEVKNEIEKHRWYVSPVNMSLYRDLELVVDVLNREIVEKSDVPARRPGPFGPKLWENADRIQEFFIFNYPKNRYEINVRLFKRLADREKIMESKEREMKIVSV